jgi:hypothetical protein
MPYTTVPRLPGRRRAARPHGSARSLKCTLVLNAAELAAQADPVGARVMLAVEVVGQTLAADIAAKALRKAKATIAEHGADQVALILQGKLDGNAVLEAGLVAQPKTPKAGTAPDQDRAQAGPLS